MVYPYVTCKSTSFLSVAEYYSIFPFIHVWTFELFAPFGYCKQYCYEHSCTSFVFRHLFSILFYIFFFFFKPLIPRIYMKLISLLSVWEILSRSEEGSHYKASCLPSSLWLQILDLLQGLQTNLPYFHSHLFSSH